jgi:hypothetical protein
MVVKWDQVNKMGLAGARVTTLCLVFSPGAQNETSWCNGGKLLLDVTSSTKWD